MLTEDLTVFFNTAELAVSAVWTPSVGAPQTGAVIFDARDEALLEGVLQSTARAILYPANQFVGMKTGDTVTINAVVYKILEAPDLIEDGALRRARLYQ